MPKKLERKLKKQAKKKGLKGERKLAYLYGTMMNTPLMKRELRKAM